MIKPSEIVIDLGGDLIGQKLLALKTARPGADREAKREDLLRCAADHGYITFIGNSSRYQVKRIGESLLYRVPKTKRGNLALFRGKLVRVACVLTTGQFERKYIAGPVRED